MICKKLTAAVFLVSIFVLSFAGCGSEKQVNGEVFIVAPSGENIKFGGQTITVYDLKEIQNHITNKIIDKSQKARTVAWYLDGLQAKPIKQFTTDSDGKFSITLPAADYAFYSTTSGNTPGNTQNYSWLVKVRLTENNQKVILTNSNTTNANNQVESLLFDVE